MCLPVHVCSDDNKSYFSKYILNLSPIKRFEYIQSEFLSY